MIGGNPQEGLVTTIHHMIGLLIGLEVPVGRVKELYVCVVRRKEFQLRLF